MNIFKQFIKSIYSPKDISTFRNQGMGKTFLYIFFLSVLSVLPLFINFVQNFNNIYDDAVRIINEEVPDFSIQDGKLHTDIMNLLLSKNPVIPLLLSTAQVKQRSMMWKQTMMIL